jgi:hypothetical protein
MLTDTACSHDVEDKGFRKGHSNGKGCPGIGSPIASDESYFLPD